ncbi:TRAP transporter large permease [Rhizobium laguerreae]|uniref:TRAP transporter large permease n=1 Tax=Rhizobium laguerreae TaxID=1076926 RepID=UPI001C90CDD3|nr:TRAP transporter large permease [Rhizobium laguerreae]MBY3557348.1 TRAP transporter large permease [Rhizobium laguerreae]
MNALALSTISFGAVLLLLALRLPLAFALGIVGAMGVGLLRGFNTFAYVVGTAPFEVLNSYPLSVLPMFILVGALAVRTELSTDLVSGSNALFGHYRGGLAIGTVVACAGFGAVSGSNLATLSTMSKITVPEMLRRKYSPALAAGVLASASTLDILIPPSIQMVVYATMTETSVGRIMAGGIIPALILSLFFVIAIRVWIWHDPRIAPPPGERQAFSDRLRQLRGIWGIAAVFMLMLGGMFAGWFSPTEAGAVGAAGVIVVGLFRGRMAFADFVASVREAVHLSTVLYLILIGIEMFHFLIDSVGLQREVSLLLESTTLPPAFIMAVIIIGLILLGCVMDATSILFITTPILYPAVVGLGYDGIWFGVVMVMLIQLGLIHPPLGLNVFILSGMIKQISVSTAFRGCIPFVIADIVIILAAFIFPNMILWLPNLLFDASN